MNTSDRNTLFFIGRFLIYAAIMVLLNVIFMHDAGEITSTGKFGENSLTEIFQELFLFMLGVIFLFVSRLDRKLTAISNLLSLFFFMAFIREFNNQIDYWFYLVLPVLVLAGWLAFRDRKKLMPAIHHLVEIPETAYLVTGFLVTFLFSRLFGRTHFWTTLLGEDYNRWAKNAAEEGIELLGYSLLLIAGVEILIRVYRNSKKPVS